jgi:hypothetical protein
MQPKAEISRRETNASYALAFSAALMDSDRDIPSLIVGPSGETARSRYNIYRNNVIVSLIDALAAVFPAVMRITGPEFFRAMARFYIRETPPRSPLLFEYGRDFPLFIERYEYAQTMPWLADTARIERAWLDAYHSADAEPLPAAALASIPSDRLADLVFVPHPSTGIVRSRYAALTIFTANRSSDPVVQIQAEKSEDTLITRPNLDVIVRRLPEGAANFHLALIEGKPLGEAAAIATEASPAFDLAANIVGMLEAGAFTTIKHGEKS